MRARYRSWSVPDSAPIADVNTTPLIDVMLVLLIIFIISIPMMDHKVTLHLPPPGTHGGDQPIVHSLNLDSQGGLSWDGQPISEASLPARLAAVRDDPRAELEIRAVADTRYEDYDRTLAIVKRAGIERLGLAGNAGFAATLDR